MLDTDALRAAAEAAKAEHPGVWEHYAFQVRRPAGEAEDGTPLVHVIANASRATAPFIAAASPAVVLALLAALDDARQRAARAEGERDALRRAIVEQGRPPLYTCPGCGRDTAVVFNRSTCPRCMGSS